LVRLDDHIVASFELDSEHTPRRARVEQAAHWKGAQLTSAKRVEDLRNLSGIIGTKHVTLYCADAIPSPSREFVLNKLLDRPHMTIVTADARVPWVPGTMLLWVVKPQFVVR
jgi:hypothetical protein